MDDQQRLEFIAWLDRNITSCEAMLGQFERQGFLPESVKEALVGKERRELAAFKVVRHVLEKTEIFTAR